MKLLFCLLLLISTQCVSAETWRPDLKFELESTDFMQTLSWLSGVSYALTQSKSELINQGKSNFICNGPVIIGSKELIEILNKKHAKHTITSEQAITAIMQGLKVKYPCL